MPYQEEDYLQLSGIQHCLFCRRQWALIHLEQQWAENSRTAEGQLMHQRAAPVSPRATPRRTARPAPLVLRPIQPPSLSRVTSVPTVYEGEYGGMTGRFLVRCVNSDLNISICI